MSPAQLLEHFDRISEVPDAVARLRRFILELAVRGKLVEQDPSDEPAAELLKRIQAEKALLLKEGKIKESKVLNQITATTPYKLPTTWQWVPLGVAVNRHLGGGTPSKNNSTYWDGDIYWASVKDIGKGKYVDVTIDRITEAGLTDSSSNLIPPGNLIVVTRMGLGKISINRIPIAINQDLRALSLSSLAAIDYYYNFFKTHGFEGSGLTVKGIKVEELLNTPFPLPPLAEQHRIVGKVDELMALCDQLEAAKNEREARRDRLVAASLQRIGTAAPATDEAATETQSTTPLRDAARFHLDHLPRLTTRPEHIKQLRQTILNLAVRGWLVPQDPNDEPAEVLLSHIQQARARLYAEKKIAKPKVLPSVEDLGIPFSIPKKWSWTMLGMLCYQVSDGPHFSPSYVSKDEGVPFLSTRNVRLGGFDLTDLKYVSKKDHEEFCKRIRPEKGDIIYTKGGTTGIARVNDLDFEFSVWVHLAVLRVAKEFLEPRYIELALNSPLCYEQSQAYTQGISNFDLGLTRMVKIVMPLPPLAEQRRVVAKVNELMALCDQLEAQLTSTQTDSRRLLEAVLHEALSPAMEEAA